VIAKLGTGANECNRLRPGGPPPQTGKKKARPPWPSQTDKKKARQHVPGLKSLGEDA
jgi:hypothetical protein